MKSAQDKKVEQWDWSPRHVRLRYEMLIVSSLVLVTGYFEIKSYKLLIFEVRPTENGVPFDMQPYVFWGAMLLFVILLGNFIFRTIHEFQREDTILTDITTSANNLHVTTKKLIEDLSKFDIEQYKELQVSFENLSKEYTAHLTQFEENKASLKNLIHEIELVSRRGCTDPSYDEQGIPSLLETSLSDYKEQIGTKVEPLSDKISKLNPQRNLVDGLLKSLEGFQEVISPESKSHWPKLTKLTKNFKRYVNLSISFPLWIQRYGFSVCLPAIISCFFVGVGVYAEYCNAV